MPLRLIGEEDTLAGHGLSRTSVRQRYASLGCATRKIGFDHAIEPATPCMQVGVCCAGVALAARFNRKNQTILN